LTLINLRSKKVKKKVDACLTLCQIRYAHGEKKNNKNTIMKTKTLLITAAAALAAGIMSSQAQVYSQNVVGYVNIPETAGQFSLEAPPLDLDGTGTNNTLSTLYPNPAVGDQVYAYSGGGFLTYTYTAKVASHGNPASTNWLDGIGNVASSAPVNVGEGVFYLPAVNETNTYVGQVINGAVTNKYVPSANGFALVSSTIPIAGGVTSTLNYQPVPGDVVFTFNGSIYSTYTYTIKVAAHGNPASTNWLDGIGAVDEPQISVGQGFWLNPAQNPTWSQTFTNN
jgi:hypothetical protein